MQANKDAKWPAAGTHRVFVMDYNNRDQCSPEFKGLITSVEESNPGFVMQWGDGSERSLIGKLIGIVFREKEFMLQDGSGIGVTTKPMYACSVERIRDGVKIPKRKLISGTGQAKATQQPPAPPALTDEECPF